MRRWMGRDYVMIFGDESPDNSARDVLMGPLIPYFLIKLSLSRRCTHRPSVIYLIVNKILSLSLSLSESLSAIYDKLEQRVNKISGEELRVRGIIVCYVLELR
jgi:hypothetical protein